MADLKENHGALRLGANYDRKAIHAIFCPNDEFPYGGPWGQQGIIRVPDRPASYIFLVTFGRSQGDHVFDESVTDQGVLSWQSQPSQDLSNSRIQDFITHDDQIEAIHLFLRTRKSNPYTYLGPLGYLTHDTNRERPVYFQFQILEWPIPDDVIERMQLELVQGNSALSDQVPGLKTNELLVTSPPRGRERRGTTTAAFQSRKQPHNPQKDAQNRRLGLAGERLVLQYEIQHLRQQGRSDLADEVSHVSVIEGDGAGFDIRSFTPDGAVKYIEVKTTRGNGNTDFFASVNELNFSQVHAENYFLYRVYGFDDTTNSGSVYVKQGALDVTHELIADHYRVRLPD